MLSFRTMLDKKRAENLEANIGLQLGDDRFVARVARGDIAIQRGELQGLDATLTAEPTALVAVVYAGQSLAEAEASGAVVIQGNRALAKRFLALFHLPPKAG
jgi:alkyl sulfatase BDS1-like metallo-beta-lactamase superfamily hydrolase